MAWRPYENLIEGELDNTIPGRVTGWLTFVGLKERVMLDLKGDFHRDVRGARLRLTNSNPGERSPGEGVSYMADFAPAQTGWAGDITAGLPPQDYGTSPYLEWYSDQNGRVVLELDPGQVEVIGTPLPWEGQEPVCRNEQADNMTRFLQELATGLGSQRDEPRPESGAPKFELGKVVVTPGALWALSRLDIDQALSRHRAGDWGEVAPEDRAENERALRCGSRLLSVYCSGTTRFWVLTEADRSATTVLLPEEY